MVAGALQRLIAAVPLDPDDLPGYAGSMFDALMDDPAVFRLSMWRQLERPEATAAEVDSYAEKEAVLTDRGLGRTGSLSPRTYLAIVLSVAQTWHLASPALQPSLPPAPSCAAPSWRWCAA
ncbi:hypothetical protein LRP67_02120 [Nocardioides sp. cx-169]|uniref:hypothetical protein n=1 Tax=Nocardioides sp. cx-169 TaxID=2899080 RepID=UPI001E475087|nr:hypothetical protein [Nocardioides sp. cx-169]MCD4532880.1 hypothetical protein [Nocardioides sp. cx-169]